MGAPNQFDHAGAGILVARQQIRRDRHPQLGPQRDVHPVGPLTLIVVGAAVLARPVHLHIGSVDVHRDLPQQRRTAHLPDPPHHLGVDHPDRGLDPGQRLRTEPPSQPPRRPRRRGRHRLQPLTRSISAAPVQRRQMIPTGQLTRRHRHQQLPTGQAPIPYLDRTDAGVQRLDQTQDPIHLAEGGQPRRPGQRGIGHTDPHPATTPRPTLRDPLATRYTLHRTGALSTRLMRPSTSPIIPGQGALVRQRHPTPPLANRRPGSEAVLPAGDYASGACRGDPARVRAAGFLDGRGRSGPVTGRPGVDHG